jgi:hypothetical protein
MASLVLVVLAAWETHQSARQAQRDSGDEANITPTVRQPQATK